MSWRWSWGVWVGWWDGGREGDCGQGVGGRIRVAADAGGGWGWGMRAALQEMGGFNFFGDWEVYIGYVDKRCLCAYEMRCAVHVLKNSNLRGFY